MPPNNPNNPQNNINNPPVNPPDDFDYKRQIEKFVELNYDSTKHICDFDLYNDFTINKNNIL